MKAAACSIFLDLLGPGARELPAAVRALHERSKPAEFAGRAQARAATGMLARLCARVAGLPRADGEVAVRVQLDSPAAGVEVWTRWFGAARFRSRLVRRGGELHELMGPVRIRFRLAGDASGIEWIPLGIDVLRLPLPRALLAGIEARESAADGVYRFDVSARLPIIGHVVAYSGTLHAKS